MRLPNFEGLDVIAVPDYYGDHFIITEPMPNCIDCGAPGPWRSARCESCHALIVAQPPLEDLDWTKMTRRGSKSVPPPMASLQTRLTWHWNRRFAKR